MGTRKRFNLYFLRQNNVSPSLNEYDDNDDDDDDDDDNDDDNDDDYYYYLCIINEKVTAPS